MKQTPQLAGAQAQMQPGIITREGFLGTDRRALVEILDEDDATVQRLGTTHNGIAARMRALREAGTRGLGLPVRVAPHFEVQVEAARGRLPCPFGERGLFAKTTTVVTHTRREEQIQFTDLQIHLIERHGFYQGRGSPYRTDPGVLARVLEIV